MGTRQYGTLMCLMSCSEAAEQLRNVFDIIQSTVNVILYTTLQKYLVIICLQQQWNEINFMSK